MNHYQASSNWTGRTPRTSRDAFGLSPSESTGIEHHQAPLPKRLFFALMNWGWLLVPLALFLAIFFKVAA